MKSKKRISKEFLTGNFSKQSCPEPTLNVQLKCEIEKKIISERSVYTLKSKAGLSKLTILYLHGGAYIHNMTRQHWKFLGTLIEQTDCTIVVPDYHLAPEYSYLHSFEMVESLYLEVLQNCKPGNLVLMGDSAGGGFALALAQKLKAENIVQPSQIILLSPWLDLSLMNPDIKAINRYDPFLGIEGLRMAAFAYAGNTNISHYLLSPLNGSITQLGQISLFIGTNDILVADARKLKLKAEENEIKINYYEYPKMIHVWMLLMMPEAKRAKAQIVKLLRHSQ
jgi:acetyl esterase/lipase